MKSALQLVLGILLLSTLTNVARTQSPANKATGSVAGRVTIADGGAAGVEIILRSSGNSPMDILQSGPSVTATTDGEGWYRLTGVAPGSYRVAAYAPAFVVEGDANIYTPGKPVNVAEGETVENINFSMTRGGIVTGTVVDPDGRPVIAEIVKAHKLDESGKRRASGGIDFNNWQTDDRGVYRIYGLEPGRYLVSAGASAEDIAVRMGGAGGGGYYRRTFYPEAAEEAQAKIIGIKPGDEVERIDIKLARSGKNKSFAATGRVIEAESGKPVAGLMVGYSIIKPGTASFGFGNSATNSQGEFRLEGLTPNSYQAFVVGLEKSDNFATPADFEIAEGDVAGLEIKMSHGSSISGLAVIEGVSDPQALTKLREKLTQVQISAQPLETSGRIFVNALSGGSGQLGADGTFKLTGLKPGKIMLMVNTFFAEKGFTLLRIEHNGAETKEIQLAAGVPVTGVRLVFAYGQGSVAGKVEVRGGSLPAGTRLSVRAVREDGTEPLFNQSQSDVDERGQFLIEGLSLGRHKLILGSYGSEEDRARLRLPKVEQFITVSGNDRQQVTLVLDLAKKEEK